jgi:flagellar motility protein MotE (MotC chaperone)
MSARLRLLPIAILGAALLLSVKIGDMWQDAGDVLNEFTVTPSFAETAEHKPEKQAKPSASKEKHTAKDDAHAMPDEGGDAASGLDFDTNNFDPMMLSRAEIDLLQSLHGRRRLIEEREREFELKQGMLAAAEQSLDEKIVALKELQAKIEGLLAQYDEKQEARLKSLVKIYESMKPKDAAKIFKELEGEILLDVVERMREAKAAPILAQLDPDQAKRITIELAERNLLPENGAE